MQRHKLLILHGMHPSYEPDGNLDDWALPRLIQHSAIEANGRQLSLP